MALTDHKKKKEAKKNSDQLCFADCKLNRMHNAEMIQCHLCQIWVHMECIDEAADDVVGIWCCNSCRNISQNVTLLCQKVSDLQHDMATLLLFARSFENTYTCKQNMYLNNDDGTKTVNKSDMNAEVSPVNASDMNINKGKNHKTEDETPCETMPTEITNQNTIDKLNSTTPMPPVQIDRKLNHSVEPKKRKKINIIAHARQYIPRKTHDLYLGGVPYTITEGGVRSYLRDIGVTDIIRVSKISRYGEQSEFRLIIGDDCIQQTIYGSKKFHKDAVVIPFKQYRMIAQQRQSHRNKKYESPPNLGNVATTRQTSDHTATHEWKSNRQIYEVRDELKVKSTPRLNNVSTYTNSRYVYTPQQQRDSNDHYKPDAHINNQRHQHFPTSGQNNDTQSSRPHEYSYSRAVWDPQIRQHQMNQSSQTAYQFPPTNIGVAHQRPLLDTSTICHPTQFPPLPHASTTGAPAYSHLLGAHMNLAPPTRFWSKLQ